MAAAVPAIAAGVGSIIGGITGGKGAKKQAKAIRDSTNAQIAYLTGNRDFQYGLNAPAITGGNLADDRIRALLNLGGDTAGARAGFDAYKASTGYDTRLREGLQSVNQRAFAGGMGQSGSALRALQDRGADVAGRYFDTYLGQLGGVSATGANARALTANVGGQTANQFLSAQQTGLQGQLGALQAGTANTQNTLQNLVNAGLFAYGSSYGKPNYNASTLAWANPFGR